MQEDLVLQPVFLNPKANDYDQQECPCPMELLTDLWGHPYRDSTLGSVSVLA